jgi:4-aminobutyrate--pyruvate transaminase
VRAVGGDNIGICPPLIATPADLDDLFARLGKAFDMAEAWVRKEGLRAG